MFKTMALAICMLVAAPLTADADPTGSYTLVGKNADNGKEYNGTVTVERTGDTYSVVWNVGGKESSGTGIGATFKDNRFEMGAASEDDIAISVGYIAGSGFGVAMYFEQPDGTWAGVWTYGGSKAVTGEVWTRQ